MYNGFVLEEQHCYIRLKDRNNNKRFGIHGPVAELSYAHLACLYVISERQEKKENTVGRK